MSLFAFTIHYDNPEDFIPDIVVVLESKSEVAMKKVKDVLLREIYETLSHPGSGRTYDSKRKGGGKHVASAPGQTPAPDTDAYRNSWTAEVEGMAVYLMSSLWNVFGRRLELGGLGSDGVYIAPRPHIRKALDSTSDEIQHILDDM